MVSQEYNIDVILELVFITLEPFLQIINVDIDHGLRYLSP